MADAAIENPYLAVVTRKNRNLKKKLQNIQKAEAQLLEGKTLNEEQLVLLSSKPSVERALLDIEAIRVQLEEVAKEMAVREAEQPAATSTVVETVVMEVSTETAPIVQVAASTQFETAVPEPEPSVLLPTTQPGLDMDYVRDVLQSQVRKLLKTLHVCSRYNSITGTNLPPDVDYFGKCLLGMTSIGDFHDALSQSVKNASMFLDPEVGSQHEAIRGMNYVELSDLIDQLAGHIDGGAGGDSMESFFSALASPPPQPEINFFGTDEIVDDSAAVAAEVSVSGAIESVAPAVVPSADAAPSDSVPRKQKEKRERKPRVEKKKEDISPAVGADAPEVTAAAAVAAPVEKPARKNTSDRPRTERPKKAPAASSANENENAAAANAKTETPPKDFKAPARSNSAPKKEKSVPVAATEAAPVAAPAKPAVPISYRAAVAPAAAPANAAAPRVSPSASKATAKPASKGSKPVDGSRLQRPAGSRPPAGDKKPANK